MQEFIEAVRRAVHNQNWYAALMVALVMPDICGLLEDPSQGSRDRYISWFEKNLGPQYRNVLGGQPHIFLSGADCYALRCAFLHEGDFDITDQRARQLLERFHFTAPRAGWHIHLNQMNMTLQLQVDVFCEEICQAVEAWSSSVLGDQHIQKRMASLARIHVQ